MLRRQVAEAERLPNNESRNSSQFRYAGARTNTKMHQDFRSLLSGRRSDLPAVLIRAVLRIASLAYGLAVTIRNRRFDQKPASIHHCGVPVISVGNLTTGGTGKSPVVCYLAQWFCSRGVRVAIVSRGYGRGDADENDEALELHSRLPDVPHVQDPDRVAASKIAVQQFQAQLILMDDGFQHRRLHRDLNLLVIDASCPFGYGYLLPRGLLREPLAAIRRADVAIISRSNLIGDSELSAIESVLHSYHPSLPVARSNHDPKRLLEYPSQMSPIESLSGAQVAVISAIGNPDAFLQTVRDCGANIIDSQALPDHDPYTTETIGRLREWISGLSEEITRVVCTHKDLVKLKTDRLAGVPLSAVIIELTLVGDGTPLKSALEGVASQLCQQETQNG